MRKKKKSGMNMELCITIGALYGPPDGIVAILMI